MSRSHRNQRPLKNSFISSLDCRSNKEPIASYNVRRTLQMMLLAITVFAAAPTRVLAEETQQWRRTKDGWMDMTEELRPLDRTTIEYSNSVWSAVWPAAATLCMGFTAYWLLTFDSKSARSEKMRKNSVNCLGRVIRQTTDSSTDLSIQGPDGELPIALPIHDKNRRFTHQ